jgi:hypothetical protein
MILMFQDIAKMAGFEPMADGKLNIPANQESAERLGAAAVAMIPKWNPGDEPSDVTLSGPGPVWGYLSIAHALHGRVRVLKYAAPNAPDIAVFRHGA